jgi:outer membrane receptor protein involved in Fe transport
VILRPFATAALLGAVVPTLAIAQQPVRAPRDSTARRDSVRVARLAPVLTTASRYDADARTLPRRIDVIGRDAVDRTPARDVLDVIKKNASVDVVQYPGFLGGVGIRGFRPQVGGLVQRTLVLVDGRPAGITNLGMVDGMDVERIELLKGPASALYGSSAMGGVVNLVTRRRSGRWTNDVSAIGGAFATSDVRYAGGGRVAGRFDADVALRRLDQRDDFRLGDGNLFRRALGSDRAEKLYPAGNRPNRFVPDTIGDGAVRPFTTQRLTNGTLRLGAALGGSWRTDARIEAFDASDLPAPGDIYAAGTPFPGDQRKDIRRIGTSLEASGRVGDWRPLLRVHRTTESQAFYDRPDSVRFVSFDGDVRTDGLQLQATRASGPLSLVVGGDWSRQRATSSRFSQPGAGLAPFSPDAQLSSLAAFAETRLADAAERIVVTLGARADRVTVSLLRTPLRPDVRPGENVFGAFNPNAGVRVALGRGLVAHGTVGRAFVAPDPFARAGRSDQVANGLARITVGNPDLAPERSTTIDLGLGWASREGAFEGDVTAFHTQVQDRVAAARATFVAGTRPTLVSGTAVSQVDTRVNAGDATLAGVEWTARWSPLRAPRHGRTVALFANGTRMLRAVERSPVVTVDGSRFAGVTNFDPLRVFDGVALGAGARAAVLNVADLTMTGGAEYAGRRLRASLAARYVGQRHDQDFTDFTDISNIRYPDFLVLDAVVGTALGRGTRLDLLLSNVTDENMYEKRGYNLPGRALSLRLGVGF